MHLFALLVLLAPPPQPLQIVAPDQPAAVVPERLPPSAVPDASDRREGDLWVPAQPKFQDRGARYRTHTDGAATAGSPRTWIGDAVPGFVPLHVGTQELSLLDEMEGGARLAFYRDPYNASSCTLSGAENCAYTVRLYTAEGALKWSLALEPLFSAKKHLEVQDVQLEGSTLYFNEACQSYASEARNRCSSLVAVDPVAGKVLWRSVPLTSNGRFVVLGDFVLTGYGFTAEPDFLQLVRRSDGKVLQKVKVATSPEGYSTRNDGSMDVRLYDGSTVHVRLPGLEQGKPRLVVER